MATGKVEFNCLGGNVKILHGYKTEEDGTKTKMYFRRKDIEKMKLPESFLAKKNNGVEIGLVELSMARSRKLIIPKSEKLWIELMKSHELVSEQGKGQRLTNKVSWYDDEKVKGEKIAETNAKQVALLVVARFSKEDLRDLTLCLGIRETDTIADPDFAHIIDHKPERIIALIEKVTLENGIPKSKGLLEATRIEAILRRAVTNKVVRERSGALFFADDQIGVDFKNALKNLQNKTKGDENSFNHVLPLIKAKLDDK